MNQSKLKWVGLVAGLTVVLMLGACKKKVAPAPPPPPPPPAAPTASLDASPQTIEKGQSTTLTWQTANATDVSIDGIGAVQVSGSRQATPADSTTYTLMAKGPGGTQAATARVTVTMPPPPSPPSGPTEEELFSQNVKDIYFNYDKADIRPDQQGSVQADVNFLKQHPSIHFLIEGHCDERGSIVYNVALGDTRANSAKQALVLVGVEAYRIHTISYGKEKPFCTEHNEECWQQNRRAHFVYQK